MTHHAFSAVCPVNRWTLLRSAEQRVVIVTAPKRFAYINAEL